MHTKRNAYTVTKIKVERSTRLKLTGFSAAYMQCFASLHLALLFLGKAFMGCFILSQKWIHLLLQLNLERFASLGTSRKVFLSYYAGYSEKRC
jgi:hypothetical protein